ncbi:hypothetical protein RUM43_008215, partial [Polyplax serrata]
MTIASQPDRSPAVQQWADSHPPWVIGCIGLQFPLHQQKDFVGRVGRKWISYFWSPTTRH